MVLSKREEWIDGVNVALPGGAQSLLKIHGHEFMYLCIYVFCFIRAALVAYGSSQARGPLGAVATGLSHSHSNSGSEPHLPTYTTAHGNARSLTHRARPGIEPTTSWCLVRFVSTVPRQELPRPINLIYHINRMKDKNHTIICNDSKKKYLTKSNNPSW